MVIGIRREDKNEWEKRVPLIPVHVKQLIDEYDIKVIIQPSNIRCFKDEEYLNSGAIISEDLSEANVIIGIKEIPEQFFMEGKTYLFFSHTIKGQKKNMPMLQSLMENKCNLIDYEKIVDEKNTRLIFFGRFAGIAGMIEAFHTLGQKLLLKGYDTPFKTIKQPYQYDSIEKAMMELKIAANNISTYGLPVSLAPMVFAFTGYGNVSRGAQEAFDLFPHKSITANELKNIANPSRNILYKTVLKEHDLFVRKDGEFNLQEYYKSPENYKSVFENYIPDISVLLNCIYWSDNYPRLVTRKYLTNGYASLPHPKLQLINDISCDLNGSIEITLKATTPDNAAYTFFSRENKYNDGIHPEGISVLSIDNLPCEFPVESSTEFSNVLKDFMPDIARESFRNEFDDLILSQSIKRGLLLHRGELTEDYRYMSNYLNGGIK